MGLFDTTSEHPQSKMLRYLITTLVFLALVAGGIWWMLRFHQEKITARRFLNAVVAGHMEEAYKLWKPSATYGYQDFLEDWGPNGFYGPVRSYHYEDAERLPKSGSGVLIVVDVSPYSPFPDGNDGIKQSKTKEVRLIVEFSDQSIAFQP
ncbi:MAG TPA: hypothetical protein VLW83_02965 [Candidatus Acidoferrales bacterium]|nr:hypothetical protein [Candidatus Acidoferrales bacterium]